MQNFNLQSLAGENLTTRWIDRKHSYETIRSIAGNWEKQSGKSYAADSIGYILLEIWTAENRIIPYPEICIAFAGDYPVGIVCGADLPAKRCFFIQYLIVHPALGGNTLENLIQKQLIDAAIDRSMALGCHGWIACVPRPESEGMWRKLGFTRYDSITFRRMGYFS